MPMNLDTAVVCAGFASTWEEPREMTQAQCGLLTKIEQGTTVFRPEENCPGVDTSFTALFERLIDLRIQGWIRLTEGRITRDRGGRVLRVGPVELTQAGRRALEQCGTLGLRR